MTGHEAADLLTEAIDFIGWEEAYPNLPIGFDDKRQSGNGICHVSVRRDGSLTGDVTLGFRDLAENWNREVSPNVVAASISCLYHETCGHALQYAKLFQTDTPLAKTLAAYTVAGRGSRSFYGWKDMDTEKPTLAYFANPEEIAAQYAGVYMADQFLTEKFDAKTSNKMLCSMVNHMNGHGIAARKYSYTNIDHFLNDLEKDFAKSVSIDRPYEPEVKENGYKDCLSEYVEKHDVPEVKDAVTHMKNGLEEAMVIGACELDRYEAQREGFSHYAAFQDMMRSPSEIIAMGKAASPVKSQTVFGRRKELSFGQIDRLLEETAKGLKGPEESMELSYGGMSV